MTGKKKIIFVPGFAGLEGSGWPEWLKKELVSAGFDFHLLDMPSVMYPEVHEWLDYLKSREFEIDENTYFVGHSLGCITIARFLAELPADKVCGGCVLVAGFRSLLKLPLLSGFCTPPLDFSNVRPKAKEFIVVMSDNDHFIPREDSEDLARELGAEIIIERGKGHFEGDVRELHSVRNIILEMDQMSEEEREMKDLRRLQNNDIPAL